MANHLLGIPKLLLLPLLALAACDPGECAECLDEPPCLSEGPCMARCGVSTLEARTAFDNYEAATISFKYATVTEDGQVNNDWDLLFGNDQDPGRDLFSVNTVTDDRSFIVDLGDLVTICDLPEQISDLGKYAVGDHGEHDDLPVHLDHLYLIRNVDTSTRQYAAVQVLSHSLNSTVQIRWYRSPDPERFLPPAGCQDR